MSNKKRSAQGKATARRSASARAAAVRKKQKAAERRRNLLVAGAVVLVVAGLIVGGILLQSQRDTTGESAAPPQGVTEEYGVVVGDPAAPRSAVIYEDFQCPVCQGLEETVSEPLGAAVDAGDVKVEYRVVSFLDHASGNEYSSRAANAAMVVLDTAGSEAFSEFHELLFANQPAEGTDGPDDDQLVEWAVEAGADEGEVTGPIEDGKFDQWVVNATDAMSQEGVNGTPTVFIEGELAGETPGESADALLELAGHH